MLHDNDDSDDDDDVHARGDARVFESLFSLLRNPRCVLSQSIQQLVASPCHDFSRGADVVCGNAAILFQGSVSAD